VGEFGCKQNARRWLSEPAAQVNAGLIAHVFICMVETKCPATIRAFVCVYLYRNVVPSYHMCIHVCICSVET